MNVQAPADRLSIRLSILDLLSVLFPFPALMAIGGTLTGPMAIVNSDGDPRKILSGMLLSAVGALGIVVLFGLMTKRVVFDRTSNRVTVSRCGLPTFSFPLSDLQRLDYVETDQDSDGIVAQTFFVMRDGRRVPYNPILANNVRALKDLAERGNRFLGLPGESK